MFKKLIVTLGFLFPVFAMEQAAEPFQKRQKKVKVKETGLTELHTALAKMIESDVNTQTKVFNLIHSGPHVRAATSKGNTPLHFAARSRCNMHTVIALCSLLLERGAEVNAQNEDGNTPLHCFLLWPFDRQEITSLLLMQGADVHAKNYDGDTPLHFIVSTGVGQMATRLLLSAGAAVNARNNFNQTPLHRFTLFYNESFNLEVAAALLEAGAAILARDNENCTPLDLSAPNSKLCYLLFSTLLKQILSELVAHGRITKHHSRQEHPAIFWKYLAEHNHTLSSSVLNSALLGALLNNDLMMASFLHHLDARPNNLESIFLLCKQKHRKAWIFLAANYDLSIFLRNNRVKSLDRLTQATPVHLLIKNGLFKEFFSELYSSLESVSFSVNIVSHLTTVPILFLKSFAILDERFRANKDSGDSLPAPELENVLPYLLSHAKSLFLYDAIWTLVEMDKRFDGMYSETRAQAEAQKMTIGQEIYEELATHTHEELLAMRTAFNQLGGVHFSELIDRALFQAESQSGENLVFTFPHFDDEPNSMNVLFANGKLAKLSQAYCKISGTLRNLAADVDTSVDLINVPLVKFETFECVHKYRQILLSLADLENHRATLSQQKLIHLKNGLMQSLQGAFNNLTIEQVKELIMAALYLDIGPVLEEATDLFARHCSVEFVKKHLPLDNTVTLSNVLEKAIVRPKRLGKSVLVTSAQLLSELPLDVRKLVISKLHPVLAEQLIKV